MNPFDSPVPYVSSRVVASGETPRGGRFARLDNDLYFHTVTLGKSGPTHLSFEIRFFLFFNPDESHAAPPFDILAELLAPHLGYDFRNLGGILGPPEVREAARRIGHQFGLGHPSLMRWSVKESPSVLPGGVRHWAAAKFEVHPTLRLRPDGFDWPTLGTKIQNSVDAMLVFLEMAR